VGKEAVITIDTMKKEDLNQVLSIEQASFTMPWTKNLFLSEFRSPSISTLFVALRDAPVRMVCAYIVCWRVADELHILNLAVDPVSRRKGIAKRLVIAALKHAWQKGAKRAFLEVRASNAAAQKLYLDLGFAGTSVRRDYYDAPLEDAVVMTLEQGTFSNLSGAA
jgi:[ribosomal protein S18]-alanine N-acetyltransferase